MDPSGNFVSIFGITIVILSDIFLGLSPIQGAKKLIDDENPDVVFCTKSLRLYRISVPLTGRDNIFYTRKLIHSPMDCRKAKYIFVYEQDVNLRSTSEIYVK